MSCARLKHSLTVPAYSEQRSTLAERSEVHASGGLGTGDRGTCCEGAGRDEPPNRGGPVVPTGRENIVASADCGHDGRSTLTWSGPSCARLSKAHALRRRPSGLVEHACGRQRVRISGYRVRLLRRVRWSIQFAVALLDPSSAEMALHGDADMVRPIVGARQVKLLSGPTGSQCQDALA